MRSLRHQLFSERNFDCCLSHHVFTDRNISSLEGKIFSVGAQRLNWSQLFLLGFRVPENVNSDRKTRREAARSLTYCLCVCVCVWLLTWLLTVSSFVKWDIVLSDLHASVTSAPRSLSLLLVYATHTHTHATHVNTQHTSTFTDEQNDLHALVNGAEQTFAPPRPRCLSAGDCRTTRRLWGKFARRPCCAESS